MKQLEMRRTDKTCPEYSLPEGYTVERYSDESQKKDYYYIYFQKYADKKTMDAYFDKAITNYPDCVPLHDTFFLKYGEEYVGTVTAVVHPETNSGYVHMVCIRNDFRGKGLATVLNGIALNKLLQVNLDYILLTTDDYRIPAIKSYLRAGFLPVMNEVFPCHKLVMLMRWKKIYRRIGIEQIDYFTLKMEKKSIKFRGKR